MGKALIIYLSQGGTTATVASNIAKGLSEQNFTVDIRKVQNKKPINIESYDVIGIGFPVYIFRIPFVVKKFIDQLPALKGKPFFVFLLYGTERGQAGTDARKLLDQKGGREIGFSHYNGEDYYIGYLRKGYLFSPDHPTGNELERAIDFGREIHAVLAGKNYEKPPYDRGPGAVYTLERLLTTKFAVNYFYRFFYMVNKKKCDQCKICIRKCPTGNIKLNKKGYPQFGGNCISCWYCEMYCPQEAISTPLDWPLMQPFNSYNVKRALKKTSIDHVPVKFARGKVERIK